MSHAVEKVTLVQDSGMTMNSKHKCLQTLICAVVFAYFTLLVYQNYEEEDIEVPTNHRQAKPYRRDRNLAEDRSQTDLEIPLELTSEFASATATVKPPSTTLDDVFISVKTTKSYHTDRLSIILKTWFQLARKQTWFFTDTDDMEFQLKTNGHMINTNCSSTHSRKALCCKMSVEFDTFLNTDKKVLIETATKPAPQFLQKLVKMSKMCSFKQKPKLYLTSEEFGQFTDHTKEKKSIQLFTWRNSSQVEVQVMNYGATITSIKVPDRNLVVKDVVIGFNKFEDYLTPNNAYFGATIGRVGNRIAKGKMKIEGKEYTLAINNGPNHLHGGLRGFDKVVWDYSCLGNKVIFTYFSPDMEEGYPGNLFVSVSFELTHDNEFIINYKAMTSKTTIVNLTNHSYFNLAGDHTASEEIYKHQVFINANRYTDVDNDLIPTGELPLVEKTAFDFRESKCLGEVINNVPNSPGFDHNFCLTTCGGIDKVKMRVKHPGSGRVMEVYTDQPGVQFYTGNFLPDKDTVQGKNGFIKKHGAFCLETQNYPNAINQSNFPSPLLNPGEVYQTTTIYKFLIE